MPPQSGLWRKHASGTAPPVAETPTLRGRVPQRRNLYRRDRNQVASTRASCVGPRRLSGRIGPARRLAPHSAAGFKPFATALWITATDGKPARRGGVVALEPTFCVQGSRVDRCNGWYCVAGTETRGTPLPRRSGPGVAPIERRATCCSSSRNAPCSLAAKPRTWS